MLQEFVGNIEKTVKDIVSEIHTALPGRIESVNFDESTVCVTPIGTFIAPTGKKIKYPVITDAPVIFPGNVSAGIEITFPVHKGDDCLIIISEKELDTWRTGEETGSNLRFDLSNAIVIPGLSNKPIMGLSEACSSRSLVIKNGDVKMKITEKCVEIEGNLRVTGTIEEG